MEMPYNDVVRKFIDMYVFHVCANKYPSCSALQIFTSYLWRSFLDAYNLPLELKYLPVIESVLKPVGSVTQVLRIMAIYDRHR